MTLAGAIPLVSIRWSLIHTFGGIFYFYLLIYSHQRCIVHYTSSVMNVVLNSHKALQQVDGQMIALDSETTGKKKKQKQGKCVYTVCVDGCCSMECVFN